MTSRMKRLLINPFAIVLMASISAVAQTESLDNKAVILLTQSGLSSEIIERKITSSRPGFDVSAPALVELKRSGVSDSVIELMMTRMESSVPTSAATTLGKPVLESGGEPSGADLTRARIMDQAKTIAFKKSSLQPSRQALEKELIKRPEFRELNLTILRYKEEADLFVDIGYVSGSWVTHRYVFRVYDRRSGAVLTAGETTSWGALAENLARHIAKQLVELKRH